MTVGVHAVAGIQLWLQKRAARPVPYATSASIQASVGSRTMIWTGLLILAFLVFHLAQFTLRITPDITAEAAATKPGDVFSMVATSFHYIAIFVVYIAAMIVLFHYLGGSGHFRHFAVLLSIYVLAFLFLFGIALVYGGSNVIHGVMTTGDFFSFTAALVMLYQPVKALGNLHNSVQQGLAAAERVFDVLDTPSEEEAITRGRTGPDGIKESIEYKGVSFRYAGHEGEVLKGVDLTIRKGEVVALVGSSGGGKTTLVNLLPRFFEVDEGSILLDGVDIREYPLWSLRKQVSVVTQDTILFNDTVTNNIAYGRKGAAEEDILAAARAAHADIFIEKLPEKYQTVIGEKGLRLSGGEKQRISIARAVLKDSPILILDEATSSLDTESERIVQRALEALMKNRTTLVIAHRLSTVINADKIVVIDKGRIAGIGPHAELLSSSPIYRKLYDMQFGNVEKAHAEAL